MLQIRTILKGKTHGKMWRRSLSNKGLKASKRVVNPFQEGAVDKTLGAVDRSTCKRSSYVFLEGCSHACPQWPRPATLPQSANFDLKAMLADGVDHSTQSKLLVGIVAASFGAVLVSLVRQKHLGDDGEIG